MVLGGRVGKDHVLIRRLRTLAFGLLTPFYFIRAGSFVSVPALVAAPLIFVTLFFAKMISKVIPLLPTVKTFKYQREEGLYFTLMMSTGLTFGTISALFGLNHGVIDRAVFPPGSHRNWQCGDTHHGCQCMVHAETFACHGEG
jgi:glutathione-regulated potassium-efflux system ancillary protein KefC